MLTRKINNKLSHILQPLTIKIRLTKAWYFMKATSLDRIYKVVSNS